MFSYQPLSIAIICLTILTNCSPPPLSSTTSSEKKAKVTNVNNIKPTPIKVQIDKLPLDVKVGGTPIPISASVTYSDGNKKEGVVWALNDSSLAQINADQLTPLKEGMLEITAKSTEDNSITTTVTLKISDPQSISSPTSTINSNQPQLPLLPQNLNFVNGGTFEKGRFILTFAPVDSEGNTIIYQLEQKAFSLSGIKAMDSSGKDTDVKSTIIRSLNVVTNGNITLVFDVTFLPELPVGTYTLKGNVQGLFEGADGNGKAGKVKKSLDFEVSFNS